ncbi:MAG TPA: hypothetical protein VM142_13060 [Acidimicrobiales bacterium]|nr:hypothetical protein [Acidimicrobiales bacterium]
MPGNPLGDNYLNVVLDTATNPNADRSVPSWGTISIKSIVPNGLPSPSVSVPPDAPPPAIEIDNYTDQATGSSRKDACAVGLTPAEVTSVASAVGRSPTANTTLGDGRGIICYQNISDSSKATFVAAVQRVNVERAATNPLTPPMTVNDRRGRYTVRSNKTPMKTAGTTVTYGVNVLKEPGFGFTLRTCWGPETRAPMYYTVRSCTDVSVPAGTGYYQTFININRPAGEYGTWVIHPIRMVNNFGIYDCEYNTWLATPV